MKHLGLFEGIGGFSLAARWMGWETVAWVEINKFCQEKLYKNFPKATGYADIKEFDGTPYRGTIDIISGGFPCQPYSTAGLRKGKEDDRHLWPEMLRVIREVSPRWVVGENVRGLTNWKGGLVFDEVQADLEAEGYEVLPFLLPACAINAPHKRDRIWFVAYSKSNNDRRTERKLHQANGRQVGELLSTPISTGKGLCGKGIITNTNSSASTQREYRETGCEAGTNYSERNKWERIWTITERVGKEGTVTNTDGIRGNQTYRLRNRESNEFNQVGAPTDWSDFPTQPPVCGGNDGIPNRLDRIKALGNAVVPQVVYQIFKAIETYNQKRA